MTTALPEGTVTLLFTDVEKSTDLRTSRGDDAAHALLQLCLRRNAGGEDDGFAE